MIADWINLSQTAGTSGVTTVTVTASSYSELLERSTSLTVRAGERNAVVTVNQRTNENFSVSPTSFDVGSGLTYCYIIINSDLPWACTSAPDWCAFSPVSASSGQQIAMVVTGNTTAEVRSGTVTFTQSGTNLTRTVSVQQASVTTHTVSITPSELNFAAIGGNYRIVVDSEDPWAISTPAWMTANPSTGVGSVNVTLTVDYNTGSTRYGTITASTTGATATAEAAQTGGYIVPSASANPSSFAHVSCDGSNENFNLTSSVRWRAETDVPWISIYPTSSGGAGSAVVYFDVEYYEGIDDRTGHIKIYQYGESLLLTTITIQQDGRPAYITVTPTGDTFSFENTGGTKVFTVKSNIPWMTYPNTWIHKSVDRGDSGTTTLTLTADANYDYYREEGITFLGEDDMVSYVFILFTQQPIPRINITPTASTVTSAASSTTIVVDANVPWYLSAPNWFTVSPTADTNTYYSYTPVTLTITYTDNDRSPYDRTGTIRFYHEADDALINTFVLTQEAGMSGVTADFPYTVQMLSDGVITIYDVTASGTSYIYPYYTEYTFDGVNWLQSDNMGTDVDVKEGDVISFRCPAAIENTYYAARPEVHDGEYNAYGNLLSLSYNSNYQNYSISNRGFDSFWRRRTTASESARGTEIVNAEYIIFPDTIMSGEGSYYHAFDGCTKLITIPETLTTDITEASFCDSMFAGCTSLTSGIFLPSDNIPDYAYIRMYDGCTNLTYAPDIPASRIGNYTCAYMFRYCTSLETPPQLYPTTAGTGAYSSMFVGCSSLKTAPALNAMSSAIGQYMFKECTSLINPPILPLTTESYCYRGMFMDCTSLEAAPVLNSPDLYDYCYQYMFSGCSSLRYIKCMAESSANTHYATSAWTEGVADSGTFVKSINASNNFWSIGNDGIPTNWTTRSEQPDIIQVVPAEFTFPAVGGHSTFEVTSNYDWTATDNRDWITSVYPHSGTSGTTNVEVYALENTGSTNRSGIVTFSGLYDTELPIHQESYPVANENTYLTFRFLESGQLVIRAWRNPAAFAYRFKPYPTWYHVELQGGDNIVININGNYGTSYILEFVAGMTNNRHSANLNFRSTARHEVYGNVQKLMYVNNTGRTTVDYYMGGLFEGDTGLVDASQLILPATTLNQSSCYAGMFSGCTNLVSAPELPFTTINGTNACEYMFYGCTSLNKAPSILRPTTLTAGCYRSMFEGCTLLKTAPHLPAQTLDNGSYDYMFQNAELLRRVTCLAQNNITGNTVDWMKGVRADGTFTKDANTTWATGDSGIPSGWTVEDV